MIEKWCSMTLLKEGPSSPLLARKISPHRSFMKALNNEHEALNNELSQCEAILIDLSILVA